MSVTMQDPQEKRHIAPIPMSDQDLIDILITAMYGAISYWCPKQRLRAPEVCCDRCGSDIFPEEILSDKMDPESSEGEFYHFCSEKCLRIFQNDREGFKPKRRDKVVTERREGEAWDSYIARNVVEGGTLSFYEDEDDCGRGTRIRTLTLEKLLLGIGMSVSNPNVNLNDVDSVAADVILQNALLGEVVYG